MSIIDQILVMIICMAIAAFLSGIEIGVVSINRIRLEHLVRKRDESARLLKGFLINSDRLFGTTLVGTNICLVVVSVLSASLVENVPGGWAEVCVTGLVSVVVIVFSEYLPKAWFLSRPLERCRRFARLLRLAELILRPFARAVVWVTKYIVPGSKSSLAKTEMHMVSKEDLKMLASQSEREGILPSNRSVMIQNILELSGKTAAQIMVPKDKMTFADSSTPISDFITMARTSQFTRIPIYDKTADQFIGIANSFYVATSASQEPGKPLTGFVRRPLLIPETTPVDEILPRLRRSRQPMCLVVNTKSKVTGLITTEDIIREIVSENPSK